MRRMASRPLRTVYPDATALLDALPAAVMAVNTLERITYVNPVAATMLGQRAEEFDGQPLERFVRLPRPLRELANAQGAARPCDVSLVRPLGEHERTTLLFAPRHNAALERVGYVCMLQTSSTAFAGAEGLQHIERLIAMGQMVAGFAHEVRNPLAALKSVVDNVIAEGAAGKDSLLSEDLARMQKLVRRIETLVKSALQFGRPSVPIAEAHDPATLVATALEVLEPRMREARGVQVRVDVPDGLPQVFVDDNQLVQVLVVLLNNALDAVASPADVTVRIHREARTDGEPDAVLFEVIDQGSGIPPELQGQIFNPFFTTKTHGSGLGLSIARRLVRDNHGHILVNSQPEAGTTFVVELPAHRP